MLLKHKMLSTVAEDPSVDDVQGQISPPTADRKPSSDAAEPLMTPEQALMIMEVYSSCGLVAPHKTIKIAKSTPPVTRFNKLLQHTFWHNHPIPLYDVNQSLLPSGENPENPNDWFDFFWPVSVLEHIVKETNIYITKKNN